MRSKNADEDTTRVNLGQDVVTTDANGTGVAVRGLDGRGTVIVVLGTPFAADNTIEVLLEESDAVGGTYTPIVGATSGVLTSDVAEVVEIPVDFTALEGFIRPVYANVAGTTPSYEVASIALGVGHVQPADE